MEAKDPQIVTIRHFAVYRLYLRSRMIIASHHFKLPLVEGEPAAARGRLLRARPWAA